MTKKEEAKKYLIDISYTLGNLSVEYLTEKHGKKMREAVEALEQEPCREADDYENEISDLYNRLDIVEYDKERLREEVTTLEEKLKGLSAEPCEDAISRQAVLDIAKSSKSNWIDNSVLFKKVNELPPVIPQPKTDVLDKIRAEIEKKIVKRPWLDFEDRERDRNDAFLEVLDIIDKYKEESEDKG